MILLTTLIVLLIPLYLFGDGKKGEITSMAELINRYDSSRCQECHSEIYAQWEKSHHARAETSARLKAALPLEVQTLGYVFQPKDNLFIPMVMVKTKISNKAGHRIPDG